MIIEIRFIKPPEAENFGNKVLRKCKKVSKLLDFEQFSNRGKTVTKLKGGPKAPPLKIKRGAFEKKGGARPP